MSQEHPPLTGDTVRTTDILFRINAVLNRFRKAGTQEYFAPAPSQQEQLAEVHDAIADVLMTAHSSLTAAFIDPIECEKMDKSRIWQLYEAELRRLRALSPSPAIEGETNSNDDAWAANMRLKSKTCLINTIRSERREQQESDGWIRLTKTKFPRWSWARYTYHSADI